MSLRMRQTRSKLLDAAYTIMSERGLDNSTIAEIIEVAGVGVGSFYNYFDSKEDLARAVFLSRADSFGADLEMIVRQAPDAAAATCYAYRRLIDEAERDSVWASFIVQLEPTMQMLDGMLRKYARVGLGIGVEAGQLEIKNIEVAITAIHAIEVAVVKSMIAGETSHADAHRSVELPLRMFGVSPKEAQRLAGLSMSALRREVRAPARGKRRTTSPSS